MDSEMITAMNKIQHSIDLLTRTLGIQENGGILAAYGLLPHITEKIESISDDISALVKDEEGGIIRDLRAKMQKLESKVDKMFIIYTTVVSLAVTVLGILEVFGVFHK